MAHPAPILIAACGNSLAGDDSFGCRVAQRLFHDPPPSSQVIDLATGPSSLLDCLGDRAALLIVDAALVPQLPPGRLIQCDWDAPDRPPLLHAASLSTHHFSIADQIELARQLGMLPPIVRLIAVSIASAHLGDDPGPAVMAMVNTAELAVRRAAQSVFV